MVMDLSALGVSCDPEVAVAGFASAFFEEGDGCFVDLKGAVLEEFLMESVVDGREALGDGVGPATKGAVAEAVEAVVAVEYLGLAVKGKVVEVTAADEVSCEVGSKEGAWDGGEGSGFDEGRTLAVVLGFVFVTDGAFPVGLGGAIEWNEMDRSEAT